MIVPKIIGHGRYSFRSRVEDEKPGELDGKKYEKTTHRITFIVDVPEGSHALDAGGR
jgi:hypothetical protein